MIKQALLFASFCFMGSQLLAGPIPTLTATSVDTQTQIVFAELDSIRASGSSFTLGATTSLPGFSTPFFASGVPLNGSLYAPSCCAGGNDDYRNGIAGEVTIDGVTTRVTFNGAAKAFLPSNTFIVLPNLPNYLFALDFSFSTTATGSFTGNSCGMFQTVPFCTGPEVANIAIDLPGIVTSSFVPNTSIPGYDWQLAVTSFNTTPEPSSVSLLLVGLVVATVLSRYRLRPLQR